MRVDVKGNVIGSNKPTEILCFDYMLLARGSLGTVEIHLDESVVDISIEDCEAIIEALNLSKSLGWFDRLTNVEEL